MSCTHHVNQASINSTFLSQKVPIPLPPLPEQRRIVTKLEELFTKLDTGVSALNKTQAQLKRYRKAVLKAACEGQLTAKWREKHQEIESAENRWKLSIPPIQTDELPKIPLSWIYRHLEDIAERVSVGYVGPTSQYYCDESSGVLFLRSQNVRPSRLDFTEVRYVTHEFHVKAKKSQLKPGDLLIVRVGANRGDSCIVPNFVRELNCANIVFAEPYEGISEYLNLYFQTENCRKLMLAMTTGSAQGVINTKSVAKVPIPIPPLLEQESIVAEVERRLSVADEVARTVEQSLAQAERLRQSILKKAFEGKLVAQDAEDEPAGVLLERIKAGKEGKKKRTRKKQ